MFAFDDYMQIPRYRSAMKWQANAGSARIGVRHSVFEPGRIEVPPANYSALVLYRKPAVISQEVGGEQRPARKFVEGDLVLRPRGLGYSANYDDPVEVTVFGLDDQLVQSATTEFSADVGRAFERFEARAFRAPLIEGLATRLAESATDEAQRLYSDTLIQTIIHELWRITNGALHPSETSPKALPPTLVSRIDDLIASVPGSQITLEQLAGTVGMSVTAFSAAIKATTGMTPYQYVLSQRLKAARDMVETTPLSLAEVAYRCGFSSQSHMTDVFRAKLGTTPGRLRSGRV